MSRIRQTPLLALLLAVAVALMVTACGRGSSPTAAADNPYGLINPGQLRVASVGDAKPYTFVDASGQVTGFEIELFRDVAKRMGISDVVVANRDFSAILPAVASRQFDAGVATIDITEDRKQTVDFSLGYLPRYLTVITKADSRITSAKSVAGQRLGVVQGTLPEAYAAKNFSQAHLVRYSDDNAALAALNRGSVDGAFFEHDPAMAAVQEYGLVSAADVPSFDAPAGFAIKKGNSALRDGLNKGLVAAMEDGTWRTLYAKWFPDSPLPEPYLPGGNHTAPAGSR